MQQGGVRRHLVELIHGRGKGGGVLVDGIEGEFLVKLGSDRRAGDLNVVVGELARMGVRVLRRIAAETRVEGKTVAARAAERRRCKRRRHGGRGDGRWRHGVLVIGGCRWHRRSRCLAMGSARSIDGRPIRQVLPVEHGRAGRHHSNRRFGTGLNSHCTQRAAGRQPSRRHRSLVAAKAPLVAIGIRVGQETR